MNSNTDLQDQLKNALGLDTGVQEPEEPNVQDNPEPGQDEQDDVVTDTSSTGNKNPEQQPGTVENKDNATIKQMREQIKATKANESKYKDLLERIAAANGTTLEELQQKIQDDEDKKVAQAKNIPVEVQANMRRQEERIKSLEDQLAAQTFNAKANELISKYNLSTDQFLEFADTAIKNGFDIRNPNLNMEMLYKSINFDKLMENKVAETRQSILSDINKQKQTSNSTSHINSSPVKNTPVSGSNNLSKDDKQKFLEDLMASFK